MDTLTAAATAAHEIAASQILYAVYLVWSLAVGAIVGSWIWRLLDRR